MGHRRIVAQSPAQAVDGDARLSALVMRWVTTAQSGFIKHPLTPAHTWSTESLGIVIHGSVDEMSA